MVAETRSSIKATKRLAAASPRLFPRTILSTRSSSTFAALQCNPPRKTNEKRIRFGETIVHYVDRYSAADKPLLFYSNVEKAQMKLLTKALAGAIFEQDYKDATTGEYRPPVSTAAWGSVMNRAYQSSQDDCTLSPADFRLMTEWFAMEDTRRGLERRSVLLINNAVLANRRNIRHYVITLYNLAIMKSRNGVASQKSIRNITIKYSAKAAASKRFALLVAKADAEALGIGTSAATTSAFSNSWVGNFLNYRVSVIVNDYDENQDPNLVWPLGFSKPVGFCKQPGHYRVSVMMDRD